MLYVLVRRETRRAAPWPGARVWILSLLPAAFVLVMGYAESVLLVFAVGCFLALRPPARAAPTARPHFAVAGVLAFARRADPADRGAARPGRRWPSWCAGGPASAAPSGSPASAPSRRPFVGLLAFLGLVQARRWATGGPRCGSSSRTRTTAGCPTRSSTLYDDARGVLHHHVGTALHVPWVLLALAMLVVCWRRLPAPYTLFAAAVLAVAVSGANLDSFERYALSAFPLSIAAALLLTRVPARAGRPHPPRGRPGRLRPARLPQHLGALSSEAVPGPAGPGHPVGPRSLPEAARRVH